VRNSGGSPLSEALVLYTASIGVDVADTQKWGRECEDTAKIGSIYWVCCTQKYY
jgi:hypothetical protein